jgi:AcrR family transcriptional regulator
VGKKSMGRKADPSRKSELREQILDYLLDHSLATLTFRDLARALDVSTYTLVYQFGTRDELITEVLAAIAGRHRSMQAAIVRPHANLDDYLEGLTSTWYSLLGDRGRRIQLVELEAGLYVARDSPDSTGAVAYEGRVALFHEALTMLGVAADQADLLARDLLTSLYGLRYLYVIVGDEARATASFQRIVAAHRRAVEESLLSRDQ